MASVGMAGAAYCLRGVGLTRELPAAFGATQFRSIRTRAVTATLGVTSKSAAATERSHDDHMGLSTNFPSSLFGTFFDLSLTPPRALRSLRGGTGETAQNGLAKGA